MFPDLFVSLSSAVTRERALDAFRATLIVATAYLLARVLRRWVTGLDSVRVDPNRAVLVGRLVQWGLLGLGVAGALEELGFKLHVLLGAAGVVSVAIGFAAQTTLSNLISGFFLYGEEPFRIGETIEVDGLTGEVLHVGTLATTLRTIDHRFVRIPNELLIKSKLTNHSRLPARRVEFTLVVPQSTPFGPLRDRLVAAARACPEALAEPPPQAVVASFGDGVVSVQLVAWAATPSLGRLRSELGREVARVLEDVPRGPSRPAG